MIEAKLLGRNAIGVDINSDVVKLSNKNLDFACKETSRIFINAMQKFVDAKFRLKEIIIKEQHNCQSTDYWNGIKKAFLMLAHEYIFILEKS